MRLLPDFTGLIRWVPKLYFMNKRRMHGKDGWSLPENKNKADNLMWNAAEYLDGIRMLLGFKTIFFSWYFLERQTGSFYEAENLWRKTEGVNSLPNRGLNQNVLPGEFVTRQEIATLYQRFRDENPQFGLANYTPDDPLASRNFEQVARYLNHKYSPKLFAITEGDKQKDLPGKVLTHAMLIELVGSKGLRVEDALGSAIRLEVMAYYGGLGGAKEGIRQYRKVSKILEKILHPQPEDYTTLNERVEAVREYFTKLEGVAKEFLGDAWPPHHIVHEVKPGFIKAFFGDAPLSREQLRYMDEALAPVPPGHRFSEYRNSPKDPASSIDLTGDILTGTETREVHNSDSGIRAEHNFSDTVGRKDRSHIQQRTLKEHAMETMETPLGATVH